MAKRRNYKTVKWQKLRLTALKRDKYLCQNCRRYGISELATVVHHLDPDDDERFLDLKNLISLCASCHGKVHPQTVYGLTKLGEELLRRSRRM